MKTRKKIFVGLSGGVDSSVSAKLLKDKGHEVIGVFIKTWHPDYLPCNEEEERRDAMRVAAHLDIPFLTFDFEKEYKEEVADYMISEYKNGRTPNPDVMCNKEIKFGAFLKKAISMGADYVATGHYAQRTAGQCLKKSIDPSKDQSYFLWTLKQEQLRKILFPVGDLKKTQVRSLAKKFKLPVAEKKDSQGICFLGDIDLKEFLRHYIKVKNGIVVNDDGEEIGVHDGVLFYTLGERHGFTITKKDIQQSKYYVVAKDIKKNILVVSSDKKSFLSSHSLNEYKISNINWISGLPIKNKKYTAQVRYHGELHLCVLENFSKKEMKINFDTPLLVDSGQSIVVYDGDKLMGGGVVV